MQKEVITDTQTIADIQKSCLFAGINYAKSEYLLYTLRISLINERGKEKDITQNDVKMDAIAQYLKFHDY